MTRGTGFRSVAAAVVLLAVTATGASRALASPVSVGEDHERAAGRVGVGRRDVRLGRE